VSLVPAERDDGSAELALDARHRWVYLLRQVADLAHAIADTDFVKTSMRGNEAQITAAILYGDEVGLAPMFALKSISIINGVPSISAEAQRALILSAGHEIWPETLTITKATWAGRRAGSSETTRVEWTMDDAKRASLSGKQAWRMYPRAMLSARASAELARAVFADVIAGLPATEELEDNPEGPPPSESQERAAPEAPEGSPPPRRAKRPARKGTNPTIAPTPPGAREELEEPPLPGEGPDEPAKPITDEQRKALFAGLRDLGIEERKDRLEWVSAHLERKIDSFAKLLDAEATTLLQELSRALEQQASAQDPAESSTGQDQPAEPAGPEGPPTGPPPSDASPDDTLFGSPNITPAGPAGAAPRGAPGPAGLGSTMIEWLFSMRREVGEDFLHDALEAQGAPEPGPITRDSFRRLNPIQATGLQRAISDEIDRLQDEDED
jgi:hypothetical protein